MFLAKGVASRMRRETASAKLLQTLQRGFAVRRVRATAISEIHERMWLAALGMHGVEAVAMSNIVVGVKGRREQFHPAGAGVRKSRIGVSLAQSQP